MDLNRIELLVLINLCYSMKVVNALSETRAGAYVVLSIFLSWQSDSLLAYIRYNHALLPS